MLNLGRARIIRNDLPSLPLEEITDKESAILFVEKYGIKKAWSWLGPQLIAHLSRYTLPDKEEDGTYDAKKYLAFNITNDREKGLYHLLINLNASEIMASPQTSVEHLPYCALVPLYMAAQKKFNKVPYSKWSNVNYIVPKLLHAAMLAPELPKELTLENILETRTVGLKGHSSNTYHSLIGIGHTELGKLPKYAQCMVAQIWCAHPSNRHEYMILDPYNWDNVPEPLVATLNLTVSQKIQPTEKLRQKMPWED